MTTPLLLVVAAWFALGAGAAIVRPARAGTQRTVYGGSLGLSLLVLALALARLIGGGSDGLVLPLGLPWVGAHFETDALAAFFLALIGLGGAAASLYGLGAGGMEPEPKRVLPFFPLFLGAMVLVVLAADAFSFLFAWELMSVSSWALVMAHHRVTENGRAGHLYLLMASLGTFALLLAFALLAGPEGHYRFAAMRATPLPPATAGVVLGLALFGAGSKAGLVPLHAWLPRAHPAAPSQASALMSGVMTKVALYGFLRIVFDLAGPPAWWWALPVLIAGGASAVIGVLAALMESDLKRVLAQSTVENIGIVFLGLGLALAFRADGLAAAAAVALTAALFHAFNHTLFKSLLFLGAGAVQHGADERNMERLGGLIHRMPATALGFLVGCMAISGLPPLNGFVSEWLTFQAILLSPALPQWALRLTIPAEGGLLALAAALSAACFMRVFGASFLGRPRGTAAARAKEADWPARAAILGLGVLSLLAGILPGAVIDALAAPVHGLIGARMPAQLGRAWLTIVPVAAGRSSYNGLLIFLFMAASALIAAGLIHRFASRAVRISRAWGCGYPALAANTQYSAAGLAQPIRRVFARTLFSAREEVAMPDPGEQRAARFTLTLRDPFWAALYAPLAGAVGFLAERFNRFQFLSIRRYLAFVFAALVLLLVLLAIWP